MRLRRRMTARRTALRAAIALAAVAGLMSAAQANAVVPANFQEVQVFGNLTEPTAVRFARDGRVFVAEKNGRIKVFDNLTDTTPTLFADLNANVYNFWDRGMLGLELHPNFPATPYVYVLYAYDAEPGGLAPRWGTPGVLGDPCPTPPGPTADGCVVTGRLSRLQAAGNVMTGTEQVLVTDWCQQYPSHSIGAMSFGADGALYVSGGDGASFNFADWGQDGTPLNPCGDPPGPPGTTLAPPTAEGGALRSQDLRTSGDPVSLGGSVLRLDPLTGAAMPDNPNALSPDPNARRIIAHGLRNPFRLTTKPGTSDVWVADVGWSTWEEVNRLGNPTDAVVDNFGWPCYEGSSRQGGYDGANLNICENLYAAGASAVTNPVYTWNHSAKVVTGETCPTGSSSAAGVAFYNEGNYPASYLGALFFSDYSRDCIWVMFPGAGGAPDPATRQTFVAGALNPVDVQMGPNGDLFYVNYDGGTIQRVRYLGSNQAPTAVIAASPTTGPTPLTVNFDGRGSTDPESQTLTYAWDLDGDGGYDDSTSATPAHTFTTPGNHTVRLRVTDTGGATDTAQTVIAPTGSTPPVATINTPAVGSSFTIGDLISFTGSATDAEDGTLAASRLSWNAVIQHCPSNCHTHPYVSFPNVAGGSFTLPDHEYPSHIELTLTATDSTGVTDTETLRIDYRTVDLTFRTEPPGLQLVVGSTSETTPFTRTVARGSTNSISALTPQSFLGTNYAFSSWSDAGAQTHSIVAPAAATTYTATYAATGASAPGLVAAFGFEEGSGSSAVDSSGNSNNGALSGPTRTTGRFGEALSFDGLNDLVSVPDSSTLDLTTGMTLMAWARPVLLGTKWRTLILKEQPGNLVYALYGNRNTTRPTSEIHAGGGLRTANGTAPLPIDAWSHVAATYDGLALRTYVDGVQVGTSAFTGAITTSTGLLQIGANAIWGEYFQGLIDEVRVYNRALTPSELAADMNSPVAPPPAPDSEPPGAPGNLTALGGLGHADLQWTAATDNTGIGGYDVHRSAFPGFNATDQNRIAQTSGTGTTFVDLGRPAGTYHYRVVARDIAGNSGPQSNLATATVTADTTGPTVSVTAPTGGSTVTGSVLVTATAADDVGMGNVQFQLDGANLGAADATAPYEATWDTTSASNGTHSLTAIARDAAGNPTTSSAVSVTVDNTVTPPPPDLVAAYSFDEASGPSAGDNSGNGNTGTLTGATWTTAGRFGSAISFDGVDDTVVVADSSSLDLTAGVTMMAWVRATALGNKWRTVLFKERTGNIVYGVYANRNTGLPIAEVTTGTSVKNATGTAGLPLDAWAHVTATYDGAALRLYVDGALITTTAVTGAMPVSTGPLRVGGNSIWGEYFQGLIDEVRVYRRALSTAEIQTDMARRVGVPDTEAPTAPTGLVATGALGRATLSWTAATDNTGVAKYAIHRSTTAGFVVGPTNKIGEATGTTYADNGPPAGVYFYRVVALDASNNAGPPSNEASATVTADTTAPTVSVTAPAGGTTVSGTVSITAAAADDVGVAGVRLRVDGVDVGSEDTTAPYEASWNTSAASNGTHTITAVARDASSNSRTSEPVQVTVDNTVAPPPPDLVAAYGFDEASGATAADQSGNGNDGTLTGATRSAAGRYGGAISFDGVDDTVVVADSNSLDLTTGVTMMAWVRATALGTRWRTLIFKERTGNLVYGVYANRNTGLPIAEVTTGTSVKSATGAAGLPLDSWAHVTATYDGAALRLYVDGNLITTTGVTGVMPVSTGPLRIGGNAIWGEYFQGLIDEVRVYRRALTQTEIQADMGRSISIPDTENPTAPTGLGAAGAIGRATLSWTAATDNQTVRRYNVHRGSSPGFALTTANRIAQPTSTGHVDTSAAAGTHYYRVTAEDAAGNVGPASNEASATVLADTTAPTVSITAPAAGATVSNTVSVDANASDDVAVASVEFRVDGNLVSTDTAAPWSASWNTRTTTNASHDLTAVARDGAGNPATSATVSVTVDNSAAPVPGLVGAWSFDENAGASAGDRSGNGNAGAIAGAAWATGKFGSSLSFDGVDDIVTVPDSNSLDVTAMTFEAWLQPSALGTIWRTVAFKHRSGNQVYALYANRNTGVPIGEITVGTAVHSATGTAGIGTGAWVHMAQTYDGAVLRLYVNGVEVATRAIAGAVATSTGALTFGGNTIWPTEDFAGRIDEVRLYNRALTPAEIQNDMATPVQPDTTPPTVASTTPAASAIDVSVGANATATFNEAMDAASITTSSFELRDSSNALVPATVSYDANTSTATLDPTGGLNYGATYTATVRGGTTGSRVRDVAGNFLAANRTWSFTTEPPPPPIVVIGNTTNAFSRYPAEILRAEGLNAFVEADVSLISPGFLGFYDVVVLGETALTPAQVTALTSWVTAGGNLIALKPDKQLASLLGLTDAASTLAEGYLQVDTSTTAGAGIAGQTMQYHGTADRYTLNGATQIAGLFSNRTTAAGNPAVTLRSVGSAGGQAAAFAFDLGRSIVYTRQGNPAWAGQDRDGINPIRPNDLFFGGAGAADWLDTQRIAIPQADEQQRLLANLVTTMARDRKPLPRYWYFPRDEKAVLVMTGDDHAEGGTAGRFDEYVAASPAGCSVVNWECVRGTSYMYPNTPFTDAQMNAYEAQGFEIAVHVNAKSGPCGNWTETELRDEYGDQLADFALAFPSLNPTATHRTHCVAWSDWATQPKIELERNIRMDTNYYHYPSTWIGALNGFMTGSGMFMRFADLDGSRIDVFQAHTHLNDEAGQVYPTATNEVLDRAIGPEGYYGYFVANHHTDEIASQPSTTSVQSALARGVPVVSAKQAYDFWNGRDKSYFNGFSWSAGTLTFNIRPDAGAVGLRAMLPTQGGTGTLGTLRRDGAAIAFTTQTVKGISYAVFPAIAGTYTATYGP
jgi:Concanavalin A-like lectin/glucanases superfamily/Bacterial Ig-like domain/Bacterial Ig domain/PKD domain/Glucose / Sorbosone dehydrogenase